MRWRALVPMPSRRPISSAPPGTTCRNHRAHFPRHLRTFPGIVSAAQMHELIARAGVRSVPISPYKGGITGSNPVAPTKFLQVDGLFETLIGGPVTTAGNHRCMLPDGEGAQRPSQRPLRPPGRAVRRRQAPPALKRHAGLKDPRRPASLMQAQLGGGQRRRSGDA